MIKSVYDTNVVVSGLLNPEGIPAFLLDLVIQGHIQLFVSEEIIKEYEGVLIRSKLGLSQKRIRRFLRILSKKSKMIKPKTNLNVLKDPTDNKFLECAVHGRAEYCVTGNTRHFPFREFRGIKIVSPREFWEIYKDSLLASL